MSFELIEFKKIEIVKRMVSRLLLQFQHSPVLTDILNAFALELQILFDAIEGVVTERSPLDAVEEQLEGLGRITGQPRIAIDQANVTWFSPDVAGVSVDTAIAWITGVPVSGSLLADDTTYRQLIEAKIFRNFAKYGSVPENQQVALLAFDADVSFTRTGMMSVNVIIPQNTSKTVIGILTDSLSSSEEDAVSIMPYPPTLRIDNVFLVPIEPFTPDTINTVDVSPIAIKLNL